MDEGQLPIRRERINKDQATGLSRRGILREESSQGQGLKTVVAWELERSQCGQKELWEVRPP